MSLNKCECHLSIAYHSEEETGCISSSTYSCGWKVCLANDDGIETIAQFLPIFLKRYITANINIQNKEQTFLSSYPTVIQNLFGGKELILLGSAYEFILLSLMNL